MNIVVYGKQNCSFCQLAKNYLEKRSLPYTYHTIETPEQAQRLVEEIDPRIRTVPVILVDDVWIGGYTELQEFLKENKVQLLNG